MSLIDSSLNVLVDKLTVFGNGHKYVKQTTHGQRDEADLQKSTLYPMMHIVPISVQPSANELQYSFDIVFADITRRKEDMPDEVKEVQSDMVQVALDLVKEVKNGGVLFSDYVTIGEDWSVQVFQDDFHNWLSGAVLSINLTVPSTWNACEIPADWVTGEGTDIPSFGRDLYINIYDEGSFILAAKNINFVGSAVTVTGSGDTATVTISGSGGGGLDCNGVKACSWVIQLLADVLELQGQMTAVLSDITELQNGKVDSVTGNIVNNTDPLNPVVTQVQSDWSETDNTDPAFIQNKPTIPSVPATIVESVTGNLVDNTDPANPVVTGVASVTAGDDVTVSGTSTNPIVGVTPHTFVRLSGTESGHPITGDIQRFKEQLVMGSSGVFDYIGDLATKSARINYIHVLSSFGIDDYRIQLYYRNVAGSIVNLLQADSNGITVQTTSGSNFNISGYPAVYNGDYSANFTLRSLIDLETLKKRLWTKAGIWDVNDDIDAGFIVSSLLWDTTNSKMYKCTDNTAGAAVWSEVFNGGASSSKSYLGGRGVISMGAGNATYIPIYSLSGTNTNQANNLTNFDGRSMKLFENTTFLGISVNMNNTQPASGNFTITLAVNGVDSALVLTIPAGSTTGDYTVTGSVAVSAGDNVAWKYSNNASATSAIIQVCYAVITIP